MENPRKPDASEKQSHASDRVRWLFDRSMIEIFVNDRAVYTRVVPFPSDPVAKISVTSGEAQLLSGRAWALHAAPAVPCR